MPSTDTETFYFVYNENEWIIYSLKELVFIFGLFDRKQDGVYQPQ